jgi:hypothetical protein
LGQGTTTTAVVGLSGGLGKKAAGLVAPKGINFNLNFGFNQMVTSSGLMMATQSIAVSVSAASVASVSATMAGALASQGIMYASSLNNNDFSNSSVGKSSNNTSSGGSKTTSQGSSSGGVEGGSNSELHHIATNKSKKYDFKNHPAFKETGINVSNDVDNLVDLANHRGRHTYKYHQEVQDRLDAVVERYSGTDKLNGAVRQELNQMKKELLDGKLDPYKK